MLDAYIKVCSEADPDKTQDYRRLVLTGFSCGKPISEMEQTLSEIRESKHVEVRKAYQGYFDKVVQSFKGTTDKQKLEICKDLSETKC